MHIKICCISNVEEAHLAIAKGATSIGLVGPMPSGPGVIDNNLIATIVKKIPTNIQSVLLTSETNSNKIIAHHSLVKTNAIQLVDKVSIETYKAFRMHIPKIKIVQVVHVIDQKSITQAKHIAPFVDVILLDSGNPNLAIKELGGTGRIHNWDISQQIVKEIDVPVFLAGGLNPQNIAAAIAKVKPAGVDVCSGVRSKNQLDQYKLSQFIEAIKTFN